MVSILLFLAFLSGCQHLPKGSQKNEMTHLPGKTFTMGTDSDDSYETERPARMVKVKSFWMDSHEVTNTQFETFTKATGYKTVAERVPDWNELKKQFPPDAKRPDDSILVPASLVFSPPTEEVDLDQASWWTWTPGASWKHPEGAGSSLANRENHPVVHMSLEDAKTYCAWEKKRLPTEAEWEMAARGGLENKAYAWGDEFRPGGKIMANTFQGTFPNHNKAEDGFPSTAPVKSFPPNGYGLFDMIGNVWEWTTDRFDGDAFKHVIKGGSYLCADNYCVNYRPSARMGAAFDSGASHIGFRCVRDSNFGEVE